MPYSSPDFKEEVKKHLLETIRPWSKVLDVGPGCGTYGRMLNNHCYLDAIEIYSPYIEEYNLEDIYIHVFEGSIVDFPLIKDYEYIILGDVLEHIHIEEAISVIDMINAYRVKCLVAVPYLYEQGEWGGNIYETHHQPDLTPEKMKSRYPSLKLLIGNEHYGYYTNY